MKYKYFIKSTGNSSAKYGACEVCDKHVSDVFIQSSMREYQPGRWTYDGCSMLFGHEQCLIENRKPGTLLGRREERPGRMEITIETQIAG